MDQLKKLLEKKKQEAQEEFGGQKFARAKDLEELRLKRLREEEEEDRARKVQCPMRRPVSSLSTRLVCSYLSRFMPKVLWPNKKAQLVHGQKEAQCANLDTCRAGAS